ncbi:hypothetical protein A8C32_05350 [Flavivirga aquatica]|uniref:Protein NO VEIN C-terminal domain-containing protein n=1 Tax=Flavivirga aquatica TaxID=1849968 RepID=A0A1E5SHM8_9FLAO|nr:DUF3883 domain-containing protein [Flavivirga aquatica]OEJ98625.1 hypothetical protein A8C32_05350 [Flavivirga aquatica]
MSDGNEIYQINKVVSKLPRWFKNGHRINSQILLNYLKLEEEYETVKYEHLAEKCKHLRTFKTNFDQMKNFGEKNHGKIFEVIDTNITLWKPLKKEIYLHYKNYKRELSSKKLDYKFVDNEKELAESTIEFFSKHEFWKATIGNAPKYFVHIQNGKNHIFGLSKFCAFKNITIEEYISSYRYKTNGGNTQKHIARITGKDWVPRNKVNSEIREEFDNWITEFHPNYTLNNASFITITQKKKVPSKRKKFIDPKTLEEQLKLQSVIGAVGEEIALRFELNRIEISGIKNPEKYIEHTSKKNSGAGFDINCLVKKDNRYIEVKSSLNNNLDFFITENEYCTLKQLGEEAFIYFVHVTNLEKKEGKVFKVLRNPILELKANGNLKPIAYKASLGEKTHHNNVYKK